MSKPDFATNAPQGYMGDWTRGAPMGRPTIAPDPRTEAELLNDFAVAAQHKSEALRLKENRRTPDGYKAQYWESAAKYFDDEMRKIKALIPLAKARMVAAPKITLRRIRLDSGGYDPQGAYWGIGSPLYWAADDSGEFDETFRADDRDHAKEIVRETYPGARFYN